MVTTRAVAQVGDEGSTEKEELRARMELNEARTKRIEDAIQENEARAKRIEDSLFAVLTKLGISPVEETLAREVQAEDGVDPNPERDKGSSNSRWRKLEIPIFGGDDAYGWTHKLERYFALRGVEEDERMQATLLALEGKVLSWFQWWERCNPAPTWEGFKLAVIRRFQPAMVQNPFELLLSLKQTSTVEAYVEEFEKYVGALKEIDQDFSKGIFLNGLKEEVRVEVKLYELSSLTAVIQKSLMIEQKNSVLHKSSSNNYSKPSNYNRSNTFNRVVTVDAKGLSDKKTESVAGTSNTGNTGITNTIRSGDYRHLTSAEMRDKREKKLCFRCDEPYSREHRCKNKQLRMIIMEEDDGSEGEEENMDVVQFKSIQLSIYSMAGLTTAKSWKIAGTLRGQSVVVLIDCGASHNFIAEETLFQLQIPVLATPKYVVEVGDGHKVKCQGKCQQLMLDVQGVEILQDFYLFGLQGVDLVLGLDWLASLGKVKADFGKLELSLKQGNKWMKISGDPSLAKTQLSLGSLMQVLKTEEEGLLLHCTGEVSENTKETTVPKELLKVLQQAGNVFQDLEGLPPSRVQDHAIHLKEGAQMPSFPEIRNREACGGNVTSWNNKA
ncbi:uncharacterized protein LOC130743580 [Lotus japonicus]|uniref:uncharacterized protein LOC130743580 n=1 Tax=Lotus japonicus TaxID=34305 RepID=UPI00258539C1|nr:uncharacterized protein LOC130743580 [Lotus japonicus]